MAQKWNLQDIRPASAPKPVASREEVAPQRKLRMDMGPRQAPPPPQRQEAFDDSDLASIDVIDGNSAKRKRVIVTTLVVLVIIGLGFFMNVLLGGAEVTVYPKTKDVSVQANFTAYTKPKVNELGYELLTLEASGERQVKAAGKETVSERAQGKIFVYNTKSTSPQRLIKNTRFESKDGLIFRIKESIEVPGATKDVGGNIVPGSVVADVFADGTGEQYNLEPTRFTVPGLKGSEQFDSVYGESTTGFTGGFEGEKYIIDENELATAKQALHLELRDKLLSRLTEERPAGFILYSDSVTVSFESLPSTEYGEALATIKEKAKLQVPMFKEDQFASFLAEKSIPDYSNEPVTILDPNTLTFAYDSATTTISDIGTHTSLMFTLKGATSIIWKFDEARLVNDLLGVEKNDSARIFSSYPSIGNAKAEVRPFWAGKFPDNRDKIKIETIVDVK